MEMHTRTSDIGHSHPNICMAAATGQILSIRLDDPATSVAYSNTLGSEIGLSILKNFKAVSGAIYLVVGENCQGVRENDNDVAF
jgi:hypothetical protein